MIQPLHEVRDQSKFDEIKKSMNVNGWQGRPILAIDMGDHKKALTGSHRIAVANELEIEIPCEIINNDLFNQICEECDWDLDMVTRDLDSFYYDLKDYDADLAELLKQDL